MFDGTPPAIEATMTVTVKDLETKHATLIANHAAAARVRIIIATNPDDAYDLPTMALEGYDRAGYEADGETAYCDAADALKEVLDTVADDDVEIVLTIADMPAARAEMALVRQTRIFEAARAIAAIQARFHGEDTDDLLDLLDY